MNDNPIINAALQVLPRSDQKHPYELVDEAIAVIAASGLTYRVCPFETVIEGPYDRVLEVIKQAQMATLKSGAQEIVSFIKIQLSAGGEVKIDDKMKKYGG